MERELDVRTAESVAIRYELAGLGSRFLAVLIDLLLQTAAFIAFAIAFGALHVGGSATLHGGAAVASATFTAAYVAVSFAIFFGYFIVAEWRFAGRTIGKRAVGIRTVRDGGYPLDGLAAVIRNLVRVLEAGLGFYLISAIVALVSKENKRLGDFAAGTIVVRDARIDAAALRYAATWSDTAAIADVPARALAERYVERRAMLTTAARRDVAAKIAARVRPSIAADPALAELDDDALLVRIATGG